MTIEEALRTLRASPNNPAAWEQIATAAYRPLLAYVAQLLSAFRLASGETAHDVTHEVLINFYERWPASKAEIKSDADLHAYLRRICRNLLIDRYRHERRAEAFIDFLTREYDRSHEPQKQSESAILTEQILAQLPPPCATIFRQYMQEGISLAELAYRMGTNPAAFYSRWYRCLEKAREIFSQRSDKNKAA